MLITAVYQQRIGSGLFCAFFDVESFPTNGRDCNTAEIESRLCTAMRNRLAEEGRAFHVAGAVPMPETNMDFWSGTKVLAFFTDRRAKALIEYPAGSPRIL